ncbi:MAG: hypothetical protein DSM106950_28125 [Stigonema ocellatum SAG 48.90 = DSM 106950]|nr:hypothetical protein [Stigonema ocellatum SAG 48.90 = DSM 106950]
MQSRENKIIVNTSNPNGVNDDIIVSSTESERLAQEKIEARMRLLAMSPEEAKKLANQALQPQCWKFDSSTHVWDESIPTHYGEDSDPC